MQKQTKNLIIILLLASILVLPSVALAAWWNPFSWGIWNRVFHFQRTEQRQERIASPAPTPTPTANSTSNWKTYKNSEYGFEFKYPTKIFIYSEDTKNLTTTTKIGDGWITINYIENKNLLPSDQWFKENREDGPFIKKTNIAGREITIYEACCGQIIPSAFVFDKDNIYKIGLHINYPSKDYGLNGNKKSFSDAENLLGQILSTFKFTTSVSISVQKIVDNCDSPNGVSCNVKWTSTGLPISDKVSIYLINKPNISYNLNDSSTTTLGEKSFFWNIPTNVAYNNKSQFQVKVCDGSICGESNYFTLHIND